MFDHCDAPDAAHAYPLRDVRKGRPLRPARRRRAPLPPPRLLLLGRPAALPAARCAVRRALAAACEPELAALYDELGAVRAAQRRHPARPHAQRRERLTLHRSDDGGRSWPRSLLLHAGPSAYSSLTLLPGGCLGAAWGCGGAAQRPRACTRATRRLKRPVACLARGLRHAAVHKALRPVSSLEPRPQPRTGRGVENVRQHHDLVRRPRRAAQPSAPPF